jgi:hypothetical protein
MEGRSWARLAFGSRFCLIAPLVDNAAELLASAPVHAIVYGFTSSSYVRGPLSQGIKRSEI